MTRQRIERKPIAHHCAEAIDRPAQIGRARREVDADGGREGQHAERRAVTAAPTRGGAPPRPRPAGGGLWGGRAKLARAPPLLRHRATRRAIRAGVWVFGIATPPALRIGEPQTPVKTGFVERLRGRCAGSGRRPVGRRRAWPRTGVPPQVISSRSPAAPRSL